MADSVPVEQFEQLLEMNRALVDAVKILASGSTSTREATVTSIDQTMSRHHPRKFDGTGSPMELEDWIREIEKVFEVVKCPRDQKVDQVTFYLSGKADIWWHNHKGPLRTRLAARGERLFWDDMKAAIRAEFVPAHLRCEKEEEFHYFT